MSSDSNRITPAPAWAHRGSGHSSTFQCGRCHGTRQTFGRRLRHVLGLKTYVCAGCIAKEPKQ